MMTVIANMFVIGIMTTFVIVKIFMVLKEDLPGDRYRDIFVILILITFAIMIFFAIGTDYVRHRDVIVMLFVIADAFDIVNVIDIIFIVLVKRHYQTRFCLFHTRDHEVREHIPHTWAPSNDTLFQSNFSA